MSVLHALLAFIVAQRLAELLWAERNTRRLRARGATEAGAAHYPVIVVLHAAWLAALAAFISDGVPIDWPLLALFVLLQAARLWTILSLGEYWTTRVITLPGAPLVRRGPYRWLAHPNYLIVAAEIVVVPAIFGAWWIAAIFGLLNAALLCHRIRVEERALAARA
ncbi:MAG: isoprenylcysteine carboxyl methyltransferase family protein [Alphaproteobacteria bacterium]